MPARQAEFLARNGHVVVDFSGELGTVRRHTRLWSWDEGEGPPEMYFEKVAVDLDDGRTISCEPGWLDKMTESEEEKTSIIV